MSYIHAVVIFGLICQANSEDYKTNSDEWFENLLPANYNKHQAPSLTLDNTGLTEVTCAIYPITIIRVSPKMMDMKIETAFYISWRDFRLNSTVLKKETNPYTVFPYPLALEMWFPFLNFGNCKACSSSTLYKPEKATLFFNHRKNETYSWVRRVETFICRLEMSRFPFDKQICRLKIKSFSNQPITVNYTIGQQNINVINIPPELKLLELTTTDCLSSLDSDVHNSCNYYNFVLARGHARQILLVLIPSIIIVIISWISFWLEPSHAAPRVALGLTSMLTLATQFSSAERELPSVSTLMALDVWMFSCILIVFISLLEFAVVGYLEHSDRSNGISPVKTTLSTPSTTNLRMKFLNKARCNAIDQTSRFVFPVVFFIFNLFFWIYYCC